MKRLRHIINIIIWLVIGLYFMIIAMVNIPMVQSFIGSAVANALKDKISAPVSVGRVDVGFLNRIIIDNVTILDKQGKQMAYVTRLSAKFSYTELFRGRVYITSAQIFTPKLNLYRATSKSNPNFQFVIDSLASKDTTKKEPVNIAINSLIIRHGSASWNQLDMPHKKAFDTNHLDISDVSSHIIINTIYGDSVNIAIKKLSMNEASGLKLTSLSAKANGNKNGYRIRDLKLSLPYSEIDIPYASLHSNNFDVTLAESYVFLPDIASFLPDLAKINRYAVVKADIGGNDKNINLKSVVASIPHKVDGKTLNLTSDVRLVANGGVSLALAYPIWNVNIRQLSVTADGMRLFTGKIPETVTRLNTIQFHGRANGTNKLIALKGNLISGAGNANIDASKNGDNVKAKILTDRFDLGKILNDNRFGTFAAKIQGSGNIKTKALSLNGKVKYFTFNSYIYNNVSVDGSYSDGAALGKLAINDENVIANIVGRMNLSGKEKNVDVTANIDHLSPSNLQLFKGRLSEPTYKARINANIKGNNINTATGEVNVSQFEMLAPWGDYAIDSLNISAGHGEYGHYVGFDSDFGWGVVYGKFNYAALVQSIENVIVTKLPGITNLAPFHYKAIPSGKYTIETKIHNSDWAKAFFDIPLDIRDTVSFSANVGINGNTLNADINAPDVTYGDYHFKNINTTIRTFNDQLTIQSAVKNMRSETLGTDLLLKASAGNDLIRADLSFDNHAVEQRLRGTVRSGVTFDKNMLGQSEAQFYVQESKIHIGDTLFTVQPGEMVYSKNRLKISKLSVGSNTQSIEVDGIATANNNDSLVAKLNNVDVAYILNLVNFHSVDFGGHASGKAYLSGLFGEPRAHAQLRVSNFQLIEGDLGTLKANVNWNNDESQIDIDAVAEDTIQENGEILPRRTFVNGYVSPKRNYIDLAMKLEDSRLEFLHTLCSSFLDNVDLSANGNLRLWGDLKKINLTGDVVADGSTVITPTGCKYIIHHAPVHFVENDIQLHNDSIYDLEGHLGIVNGGIHHRHLSHLTYDIDITAHNLLAFNLDGNDGSSFYGKVFGNGEATITGRPGSVDINVIVTPQQNSEIVYDISNPSSVSSQDFIHWSSKDSLTNKTDTSNQTNPTDNTKQPIQPFADIPADMHISLSIDTRPNATLRIIMDKSTGDFITLNGSGGLRATYFNKGGLNIFGTYTIDHGIYSLTIQNLIKRVFNFSQGGTITFGGDPYDALLSLKAEYPLASVSLSDLQLGRSFSSDNIRVTCLMDITGTPSNPQVNFGLDFPTMGSDAKQMVQSVINGEEEMNQQVLYLLAVGRFYSRGTNNANTQSNQTSLAMQSILSGQVSQGISSLLGNVVKSNNWNFGANISTGDEGFNNAQYEGLLSGHLLNNRLLFNGQFGYRDNANATTSFIGDFDLRYLILPSGNLSIHVYNQANDRYFTRNSLNTQGIGFIIKKDFGSFRDLLGIKGNKKKK